MKRAKKGKGERAIPYRCAACGAALVARKIHGCFYDFAFDPNTTVEKGKRR